MIVGGMQNGRSRAASPSTVHDRRLPPGIVARRDWRRRNHETPTVGRSSHNDRVRAVGYDGIVVGQAAGFAADRSRSMCHGLCSSPASFVHRYSARLSLANLTNAAKVSAS
jgi:hypothetical protein